MSVSLWFLTPSEQVAVWQVTLQTALVQSLAPVQSLPSAHFGQLAPPQSVSLSVPFFTPSGHAGARQVPAGQTPLWQSAAPPHVLPVSHLAQLPPQSLSVSLPFFTRSEQLAVWQMLPVQTPLLQSTPEPHARFVSQRGQVRLAPPQSMSDSSPFLTTSE